METQRRKYGSERKKWTMRNGGVGSRGGGDEEEKMRMPGGIDRKD